MSMELYPKGGHADTPFKYNCFCLLLAYVVLYEIAAFYMILD